MNVEQGWERIADDAMARANRLQSQVVGLTQALSKAHADALTICLILQPTGEREEYINVVDSAAMELEDYLRQVLEVVDDLA